MVFTRNTALELTPSDPKALFRRCQAYEELGRFDEAYKDAKEWHRVDPKNAAVQPVLARLHAKIQEAVSLKYCIGELVERIHLFIETFFRPNSSQVRKIV